MPEQNRKRWVAAMIVCGLLAGTVGIVFGQAIHFDFVNLDDPLYVSDNPHVVHGLSDREIAWSCAHLRGGQWLPLVWVSYMVDSQCYGLWPGGYHLTNVLLHALTAMLLFLVLRRMTRTLWPGAIVATVFAIHPLRAESVAWITERKDMLSGLFFMLTLAAYVGYTRRPFSLFRYLTVMACFVLGLMAKPMLATLPFVLLLLDYWPLERLRPMPGALRSRRWGEAFRLLLEKLPLLTLSAIACGLTVAGSREGMASLTEVPWGLRIANVPISYVAYLGQVFWPRGLAVPYPFPKEGYPCWEVVGAVLLLVAISTAAILLRKRHPYLLVGWLWYLGMLIPVIGLMQAGEQSRADRFTYLSQIGIYLGLAWSGMYVCGRWPAVRWPVCLASGLVLVSLAACARRQTSYWRDSETLWTHTFLCNCQNATAHENLAKALSHMGRSAEALGHYQQAVRIKPGFAEAHYHWGVALDDLGRLSEAVGHFEEAVRLKPRDAEAHNALGSTLARLGRTSEAMEQYQQALQIEPQHYAAHNNLANTLSNAGRLSEAVEQLRDAVRIRPDFAEAYINLGGALADSGRHAEAIENYQQALHLKPDFASAHYNLGNSLFCLARLPEAIDHYRRAAEINPDHVGAHNNWGNALLRLGRPSEAVEQYQQAIRIKPEFAQAHMSLSFALAGIGRFREAIEHGQQAARLMPDHPKISRFLAWLLATHEAAEGGDPARAVELAEHACAQTGRRDAECLDALAAAYAAASRFDEALATAQEARRLAEAAGQRRHAEAIQMRLELYRDHKPYREPAGTSSNR